MRLAWLGSVVLQWLPGAFRYTYTATWLPAILSIYFDLFSGVLQSFIFCMLTVLYIAQEARRVNI